MASSVPWIVFRNVSVTCLDYLQSPLLEGSKIIKSVFGILVKVWQTFSIINRKHTQGNQTNHNCSLWKQFILENKLKNTNLHLFTSQLPATNSFTRSCGRQKVTHISIGVIVTLTSRQAPYLHSDEALSSRSAAREVRGMWDRWRCGPVNHRIAATTATFMSLLPLVPAVVKPSRPRVSATTTHRLRPFLLSLWWRKREVILKKEETGR